ncbi:MAG: UDP-N-acetylmuramyl-tripeptide synthetase [Patescibacteria group bacterium]|jgi:UDP-N-acetylmuramoyl-L-alanyl-D-glutamate--2,6-diaminopimelate ligase
MDNIFHFIKRYLPKKFFSFLQPAYHFVLNWLGAILYRHPSEDLIVVGVTGTTGKTSSVYLIAKTLEAAGYKVGYTSTAMFNNGQKEWLNNKKMTMVGRFFNQKILRQMVNNKCQYAIIETTSEGIKQFRHRFINYDVLIFTGLYSEHIESHGSFEKYKQAKGKLFAHLKNCRTKYVDDYKIIHHPKTELKKLNYNRVKKTIIANYDDEEVNYFLNFWAEQKIGYTCGIHSEKSDELSYNEEIKRSIELIKCSNIVVSGQGTSFDVFLLSDFFASHNKESKTINIKLNLLGDFSAINAMTAVVTGLSQDLNLGQIKKGLENVKGITGRLEMINEGQNFTVVVDYAYEPKAVSKLYDSVGLIPHNKIIHVLGSTGGGRDKSRRSVLGDIAGRQADYVIVTNEDPYDEDPLDIIAEVFSGAVKAKKIEGQNLFKIVDRREAIRKALSLASAGDIVLVTGKGSEQAICLARGKKIAWDDRRVVKEELLKL